jgi:hypothetical protein
MLKSTIGTTDYTDFTDWIEPNHMQATRNPPGADLTESLLADLGTILP